MTQLRNLLERIDQGGAPSLGFGAAQSSRLPAMALIARCSGDLDAALLAAGDAADAVVIAAPGVTSRRVARRCRSNLGHRRHPADAG